MVASPEFNVAFWVTLGAKKGKIIRSHNELVCKNFVALILISLMHCQTKFDKL